MHLVQSDERDVKGDERVGVLRYGGMEDEDAHGALGTIDGRRHVGVEFFDEHFVCVDLSPGGVLAIGLIIRVCLMSGVTVEAAQVYLEL